MAHNIFLGRDFSRTFWHRIRLIGAFIVVCASARLAGQEATSIAGTKSQTFDVPPEPIHKVVPEYPKDMIVYKTVGFVVADLLVDATGKPTRPRIVDCAHADFEAPAIKALLQWRFKPAMKAGRPVEAICRCLSYSPSITRINNCRLGSSRLSMCHNRHQSGMLPNSNMMRRHYSNCM